MARLVDTKPDDAQPGMVAMEERVPSVRVMGFGPAIPPGTVAAERATPLEVAAVVGTSEASSSALQPGQGDGACQPGMVAK